MNILLFANIGSSNNGFYHVGDEAMFYEAYAFYHKNFPSAKLSAISSGISHQHLKIKEYLNPLWPTNGGRYKRYYVVMVCKTFFWRITHRSLFSPAELEFVKLIENQDRLHMTGGGNLTSLFSDWLYYSLFIITIARVLGKDIILSSQTIGPLRGKDWLYACAVLNLSRMVILREPINRIRLFIATGIFKPKVTTLVDSAYSMSKASNLVLKSKQTPIRIGLSLHNWKNYGYKITNCVVGVVNELALTNDLEIVLIPHQFELTMNTEDIKFMNEISKQFKKNIQVTCFTYKELMKSSIEPAMTIKFITSKVDLLLTNRYHGLIFAISENIPSISFTTDFYYYHKLTSALMMTYGKKSDYSRFVVDLNFEKGGVDFRKKTCKLLKNINIEKQVLVELNQKIIENLDIKRKQYFC